jgi:uncharacterized membrane protein YfcA
VAGIVAGGIASVTGFGIGSVLTPVLAVWLPAKIAVAVVAIPHVIGTALRFWFVRRDVDRRVMWSFGLASAAGGLTGALLQGDTSDRRLILLLAALLLFVAITELTGVSRRLVFKGPAMWIAGAGSGLLGGMVGNQGGLRSAALLGFGLPRDRFIATATAIALFVDGARLPIYLARDSATLWDLRWTIAIASAAVVIGTLAGAKTLRRIPEPVFRRVVAVLLAMLGVWLVSRVI